MNGRVASFVAMENPGDRVLFLKIPCRARKCALPLYFASPIISCELCSQELCSQVVLPRCAPNTATFREPYGLQPIDHLRLHV
jgi:hypothetical protein